MLYDREVVKLADGKQLAVAMKNAELFRRPRPGGIAGLGDSITAGSGAWKTRLLAPDSWLTHVVKAGIPYTVNGGVSHQTTQQILDRTPGVLAYRPKAIVVVAGVNDVYERHDVGALDRIRRMVQLSHEAGVHPLLATILPVPDLHDDTVRLNAGLRRIADEQGVDVVDFHAVVCPDCGGEEGLLRDGLHPNRDGAEALAQQALPVLHKVFTKP